MGPGPYAYCIFTIEWAQVALSLCRCVAICPNALKHFHPLFGKLHFHPQATSVPLPSSSSSRSNISSCDGTAMVQTLLNLALEVPYTRFMLALHALHIHMMRAQRIRYTHPFLIKIVICTTSFLVYRFSFDAARIRLCVA